MIFIGDFNVERAFHAEAPTTSLLPPYYLPTTSLLPPTIHHLAPAKLARAAVPATPALPALPALPGLPGAVPRRLGAVWLTGPEDPGEAKKAVPAAPSKREIEPSPSKPIHVFSCLFPHAANSDMQRLTCKDQEKMSGYRSSRTMMNHV